MGFWQTGYMEFHEPTSEHEWPTVRYERPPPVFPCSQCSMKFSSADDLAVHLFDGHVTDRPLLALHGRECGRSRLSVIAPTAADDWQFRDATAIVVNGKRLSEGRARSALSSARTGVVSVALEGDSSTQTFEFDFKIADEADLAGVDGALVDLVRGRSLTIRAIESFLERAEAFKTARPYRDGLANYFYGVLAREESKESGLIDDSRGSSYAARFDEAVASLGMYDRPPAEAICGLVAFHYNHFDSAMRRTESPRVAQVARRLAMLLEGTPQADGTVVIPSPTESWDRALSDAAIERVLGWCSIRLDGSESSQVSDMEAAMNDQQPQDTLKLRIIAAEHYLAAGLGLQGRRHMAAIRHSPITEAWADSYRARLEEAPS